MSRPPTSTELPALLPEPPQAFSRAEAETILAPHYRRGDRLVQVMLLVHCVFAAALAPFYDTYGIALAVAPATAALFWLCRWASPKSFLTRCMGGVCLQVFVALHIYQLHGQPEMHFFFFTAFVVMVANCDWKAMWPGTLLIIGQHIAFAMLTNSGYEVEFFEESYVGFTKLFFHFGIAIMHVILCGLWAAALRTHVLTDAAQRAKLDELAELSRRADNGIASLDRMGRVRWSNAALARTLGRTESEVAGSRLARLIGAHGPEAVALAELLAAGGPGETEAGTTRPDGSSLWLRVGVSPAPSGEGCIVSLIDLTARRRAEEDLRLAKEAADRANAAKGSFLATMSHEIRTPLNAVLGMAGLMLETNLDRHQRDYAQTIRLSGDALLGLINDILDFSKNRVRQTRFGEPAVRASPRCRGRFRVVSRPGRRAQDRTRLSLRRKRARSGHRRRGPIAANPCEFS